MKKSFQILIALAFIMSICATSGAAETSRQYRNRFKVMLDYAVRINEKVRLHLQDNKLCAYAQAMAKTNAREAEQMSPPEKYSLMHPHFLLVLENVERALYFASRQRFERYRHHQKIVREELHILETLAERAGIDPYDYRY